MSDEAFLRMAASRAREGAVMGNTPFGACLVKEGSVIACEHNRVWKESDITAHAEIVTLRAACKILNKIDLSGCVLYSTCEPCPMCFSAAHWARVSKVIFGAQIEDARAFGFNELMISNASMKAWGGIEMEVAGPVLKDEMIELFQFWSNLPGARPY